MINQKFDLKGILTFQLESLATILSVDFSALAFYDPINLEFRWRLATGSLTNRFTSIVVRSGKGICGRVLKTKREFIITNFPEELQDESLEFPILIVEELKSAVAVPLVFQTQLIGVLLIGQRDLRKFDHTEIDIMKVTSEEIVQFYTQEQKVEKTKIVVDRKEIKKSALSSYFVQEKTRRGKKLEIILLDQRITLLSDEAQQSLISIFDFLLDRTFLTENNATAKVLIELKSDHQFAIQIETNTLLELSEELFSQLADKVRKLRGSIEIVCDQEKTILTMNFFLSMLLSDQLWTL